MMQNKPRVSIIILTTNALEMTKAQLLDVAKLDTSGITMECLVVDNNSNDGTEKEIKNYSLPNMSYKFIQAGENLGFAGGNNIGIRDALKRGFDYILLMNNDLILTKDVVKKMVNFIDKDPDVGMVSPKMYFAKGYEFHKDRYTVSERGHVLWYAGGIIDRDNVYTSHRGVDEVDHGQYDKVETTDMANGACVVIRKKVFEEVGFLDDSFFLYWEDADFSERVKDAGYKVVYYPKVYIWHKVSSSTGGSGSMTNDYFLVRNRFFYSMKHSSFRTKFAVLRDTVRLVFNGRRWQKIGAIDALINRKGMGQWAHR